jgi:hypothetical protein
VYDLNFDCSLEHYRIRAVLGLAEKWSFDHVTTLVKHHFNHGKCEDVGYAISSIWRLRLGMDLGLGLPALESVRLHHDHYWCEEEEVSQHVKDILETSPLYLHDKPIPGLMGYEAMEDGQMFELGKWGYREFLELSPTSAWAILRARYLAIDDTGRIDGKRLEHELKKLLVVIMPVSQIYINTLGKVSFR